MLSFLSKQTASDRIFYDWLERKNKKTNNNIRCGRVGNFPGNYNSMQLKTEWKHFPRYPTRRLVDIWPEAFGTGHKPETCQGNFDCKDRQVSCWGLGTSIGWYKTHCPPGLQSAKGWRGAKYMELGLRWVVELYFWRIVQSTCWLLEERESCRAKAVTVQKGLNYSVYSQCTCKQLHGGCTYNTLCICYYPPVARLPKPDFWQQIK